MSVYVCTGHVFLKCRHFNSIVVNNVDYLKKYLCSTYYQVVGPRKNQIRCAAFHAPNIKHHYAIDRNRSLVHYSLITLIPFATSFRNVWCRIVKAHQHFKQLHVSFYILQWFFKNKNVYLCRKTLLIQIIIPCTYTYVHDKVYTLLSYIYVCESISIFFSSIVYIFIRQYQEGSIKRIRRLPSTKRGNTKVGLRGEA